MGKKYTGFTIVELLIVVVVIAILAAVTIVAYNGITQRAADSAAKTNLSTATSVLETDKINSGAYPGTLAQVNNGTGLTAGGSTRLEYTSTGTGYCVTSSGIASRTNYYQTESSGVQTGTCPGHVGYTGGPGAFSTSSIFGLSAPTGTYNVYNDGGGGLWIGNRFYTQLDNGVRVVGMRVWEPPSATATFLTQNIDVRAYLQDWLGTQTPGWASLPAPSITQTFTGTRTAGTWTNIWFNSPITLAKAASSSGTLDLLTLAVKYRGGSYDGVYYAALSPNLNDETYIESNQLGKVFLSDNSSVGRAVSTAYTNPGPYYYGIDLIVEAL